MTDRLHVELINEYLRTLSRVPQTPLVRAYRRAVYDGALAVVADASVLRFHIDDGDDGDDGDPPVMVKAEKRREIENWLRTHPWYISSLIAGLVAGDENLAWGLAYG